MVEEGNKRVRKFRRGLGVLGGVALIGELVLGIGFRHLEAVHAWFIAFLPLAISALTVIVVFTLVKLLSRNDEQEWMQPAATLCGVLAFFISIRAVGSFLDLPPVLAAVGALTALTGLACMVGMILLFNPEENSSRESSFGGSSVMGRVEKRETEAEKGPQTLESQAPATGSIHNCSGRGVVGDTDTQGVSPAA